MSADEPTRSIGPSHILTISTATAVCVTFLILFLLRNYHSDLVQEMQPKRSLPVVIATRELAVGRTIQPDDVTVRQVITGLRHFAGFTTSEQVIGRVPTARILPGEVVRDERLAAAAAGTGLDALLAPGQRAVSIDISDGSAVSGFLKAGNTVDVLATLRGDAAGAVFHTVTLLQDVRVLAVDARHDDAVSEESSAVHYRPSVTLAVSPEQAERLAHAHTEGVVTLTLRNDTDHGEVDTPGTRVAAMLSRPVTEVHP
jgi:pilus assembly protein CpaB